MKLAVGTVQFGLPYGVTNERGQVPYDEVAAILEEAAAAGCDTIDTAMGYGDAESVLGSVGVAGWRVVTKLPPVPEGERDVSGWARRALDTSLTRLRVSRLYGVLLHRPEQIFGPHGEALLASLDGYRSDNLAVRVGVSVSSPDELTRLMPAFDFSIVQAPFNHFDRRLVASDWIDRLKAADVELHTRSMFLQGLLLLHADALPPAFARWAPLFAARDRWLRSASLTPLVASVGDALAQPGIDRVVAGVASLAQWREILDAVGRWAGPCPPALACDDEDLINPARWRLSS